MVRFGGDSWYCADYIRRIVLGFGQKSFDEVFGTDFSNAFNSWKTYAILQSDIAAEALLPQNTVNLSVAGRCISADQLAHSAVRVMPPCIAMGQAAGTAAAIAVRNGQELRGIDIKKLQAQLVEDGVFLQ